MKKKDYLLLWALSIGLWLAIMPLRGYYVLRNSWMDAL